MNILNTVIPKYAVFYQFYAKITTFSIKKCSIRHPSTTSRRLRPPRGNIQNGWKSRKTLSGMQEKGNEIRNGNKYMFWKWDFWKKGNHRRYEYTRFGFIESLHKQQWSVKWKRFLRGSSVNGSIWATSWQNQHNGCAPSEDSDQHGHPPNQIRVFTVRSVGSWGPIVSSCGQRRLWSDWADAQADLSIRWAHRLFCWFCHETVQLFKITGNELNDLKRPKYITYTMVKCVRKWKQKLFQIGYKW